MNLQDGYCKKVTDRAIDWNMRIFKILHDEDFDKNEVVKWRGESSQWVTCAVGNACSVIPRGYRGRPHDNRLASLGEHFHDLIIQIRRALIICDDKSRAIALATKAQNVLCKIEKRSSELIAEIG